MIYRVIQWGTGNVGAFTLRFIIEHPELELVGVCVHSDAKAGKDAGELCGLKPVGIRATNDVDAILALDADCVCYTATADLRPFEAIEDICRILESGKDVVSSSVVPLVHPQSFFPELRDKLAVACKKGGTSFSHVGDRPRLRQRSLAAHVDGPVRPLARGPRPRDHQLRHLQPARGALRDDGVSESRWMRRRCCSRPGRWSSHGAARSGCSPKGSASRSTRSRQATRSARR